MDDMNLFARLMSRFSGTRWGARVARLFRRPQGTEGIDRMGHRGYVGGLWDKMGRMQFEFLLDEGLEPYHYLLDIGCGSLRAGIHFIPYLEAGHYLGIDKEEELIQRAITEELGMELFDLKKPQLVVSAEFEFDKFTAQPNYALAQSLFTHLPQGLIGLCFANLRQFIRSDGNFYATFFQAHTELSNPTEAHDHLMFFYTWEQMEDFGAENGWRAERITYWDHPRGQVMVRYEPI